MRVGPTQEWLSGRFMHHFGETWGDSGEGGVHGVDFRSYEL